MGGNWSSRMQFQNCMINGRMQLSYGLFSIVNSTLSVSPGQYHISMGTDSSCRAALVGCNFSPVRSIYNPGSAYRVILDGRRAIPNALPDVSWQKVKQDYLSRQPARTNLYVVTDAAWGAQGDGVSDDARAIQSALNAAGAARRRDCLPPGRRIHAARPAGCAQRRRVARHLRNAPPDLAWPGWQEQRRYPPALRQPDSAQWSSCRRPRSQ